MLQLQPSLGYGNIAAQSCLRCQKIVAALIPSGVIDTIAYGQKFTRLIEEEVVINVRQFATLLCNLLDRTYPLKGSFAGFRDHLTELEEPVSLLLTHPLLTHALNRAENLVYHRHQLRGYHWNLLQARNAIEQEHFRLQLTQHSCSICRGFGQDLFIEGMNHDPHWHQKPRSHQDQIIQVILKLSLISPGPPQHFIIHFRSLRL